MSNPFEARQRMNDLLRRLHKGELQVAHVAPLVACLLDDGLEYTEAVSDLDAKIKACSEERRAASQRQVDLMHVSDFLQGAHFARQKKKGAT